MYVADPFQMYYSKLKYIDWLLMTLKYTLLLELDSKIKLKTFSFLFLSVFAYNSCKSQTLIRIFWIVLIAKMYNLRRLETSKADIFSLFNIKMLVINVLKVFKWEKIYLLKFIFLTYVLKS